MKHNSMAPVMIAAAAALFVSSVSLRAAEIDDRIEASFKESYVYQTWLKDDAIKADAKDGVVSLTGTVADESHKVLAEETVANLAGVTRVDSELQTTAEATAENADEWIGRKVKVALLFHRNVSVRKTEVEVKDGIVTLTGEASSLAQKELTTEYANDVEGVKAVKNEMTVAATPEPAERTAGEKIDDASVTAQVKMVLHTHRSTSAVKTKVETRNGEVTLTGIAKNAAEISLVSKLVADTQGVTSVKNLMTIE
ncbi:MAG: BON domain-containing protein [Lentisphaeria bacterium]|jgi:osmotically-inducible protein OsmY|nr:BON domain-containing protein [Lentisphaeria bacterium]